MIFHCLHKVNKKNLILASSSPRRKEILKNIGLDISIIPSLFEENLNPDEFKHPKNFVIATAEGKAKEVTTRLDTTENNTDIVIGADTCVCYNGKVYGKPKSKDDAFTTLSKLSGNNHEVITGVSVMVREGDSWKNHTFSETTSVNFAELSPQLINAYIDTGEPMDKAGGYGIQALGGALIEGISGDYYNVMGFPLHKFCKLLADIVQNEEL